MEILAVKVEPILAENKMLKENQKISRKRLKVSK